MNYFNTKLKLFCTVVLLFMCQGVIKAQLNGTYTVYGTGANFPNLQAAANALSAGVSGPVVFKIRPGTWSSTTTSVAVIGNIAGANATNNITFEAESGSAANTIISNTSTSSNATLNCIFYFDDAKYIRVRNLTLEKTHATYGTILRYIDDVDYTIVENCILTGNTGTSTSTSKARVYGTGLGNAHNNSIRNNTIETGSYGVYWYGTSQTSLSTDNEFYNNELISPYAYGFYTYYTSNLRIVKNSITRTGAGTFYGYFAYYADDAYRIDSNSYTGTAITGTNYGINVYYSEGTINNRGSISYNNIDITSSTTLYGARVYYGNDYDLSNNKITVSNTTTLYPLYNYNYYDANFTYGNRVYVEGNVINANTSTTLYMYGHYYYSKDCRFNNNTINTNSGAGTQYLYLAYYYQYNTQFNGNKMNIEGTTGTKYMYANYYYSEDGIEFNDNDITMTTTTGTTYMYGSYYSYYNLKPGHFNNNKVKMTGTSGALYSYMGYYNYSQTIPGNQCNNNTVEMTSPSGSCYNYMLNQFNGGELIGNVCDIQSGAAAYGLYAYGNTSSAGFPWVIKNNKVTARGGTGTVYGMYCFYATNADVSNNVIYATGGSTAYGFYGGYNYGAGNYYNNTIYAHTTGGSNTCHAMYCYQSTAGQFATLRNNVISRGAGGSGYLLYAYNPAYYDMDYNNLQHNGATLIYYGLGGLSYPTVTAHRAGQGQNMNSLTYDPGFMSITNADLRPNPANANSWSLNGRGEQIAGNNMDIQGSPRAEKTIDGVPDLGAYEFTPTSTPPNCTLTPAAPAPSSTQVVTFGEDTVAVLRWNAAVPNSGFNVKQYTGTNPPGIASINPTRMFYYVDFQGTGSSLDYEQDLYYKEPWLGTIASKSALRLAEKVGSNSWSGYTPANSSSNIVRNFIATPSVNDVGALFTGIDVSNNAGVDMILEPATPFCPGAYTVKVQITNNGNNVLNNVKVSWQENGTFRGTINHTTAININGTPQGNKVIITLGNVNFGSDAVNIKVWTFEPNGIADPVPTDDTLNEDYHAALSGVYTVGGATPNFPNVVAANDALQKFGTCGDVVFDIRPGTYLGQIALSSAANVGGGTANVKFRSVNSDPATTVIAFSAVNTAEMYTLRMSGASKFTFENLGITALNPTGGIGVEYGPQSSDNLFRGCNINVGPGTSSNLRGVYNSGQSGCDNNNFVKCNISSGYYGIYWYTSSAPYTRDLTVDSCNVTAYYYGIYTGYSYSPVITNNTVKGSVPGTSYYGVYAYTYNSVNQQNVVNVSNNKISDFRGYSLYVSYPQGTPSQRGRVMNNSVITANNIESYYPLYLNYPENVDVMHNTIVNNGTNSATYYGAYVYFSSYSNNRVYNNVFANLSGGYALYSYYLSGYNNDMDYNNLYTNSTTQFSNGTPTVTSFDAWRSSTGFDKHSVTYDPAITSATNPAPNVTNPAVWALNGHAVHVAGDVKDINGKARVDNRVNGVPDIGAYEVTPEVVPPAATANPAIADQGDVQIFTFAGNEVGRIKWGYTMPVAPVTVHQFSGEKGPGVSAAASPAGSMYFHTDVTTSGSGNSFDFDLNIDYMDIWLGDINDENNLRMAHRVNNYPWMVYSGSLSTVDATANNLDAPSLNRFDAFTGLENNSVPSAFVRTQGSTIICIGNSVVLNAEPNNGDNYKWYRNGIAIPGADGANARTYTANQGGDYSVAITFSGKVIESVPVTVSTIAAPNALIAANSTLTYCPGNGLTLNAGNTAGVTYQWQLNGNDIPGATGGIYAVQQSGDYTVVATNVGCSSVSAITPVTAGPLEVSLGNDTTYCEEKNVWAKLDAGYPGAKYRWSTGDTSRIIELRNGGNIWVEVDAGPGCVDRDTIKVTIDPLPASSGISFVQNGNTYTFFPSGATNVTGGYLWIFSDGSQSSQYSPTKTISGDLYVRLVMYNACGTDTTQLGWPLSVNELAGEDEITVYPNPARDQVTLTAGNLVFKTIEILNSLGSIVYRADVDGAGSHTANVGNLAAGHYMIRATTGSGLVTRQFDIIK